MVSTLSCTLEGHQSGLQAYLKEFAGFSFLWQEDIESHYRKFLEKSPSLEVTHTISPAQSDHMVWMRSIYYMLIYQACFVCRVPK